MYGVNLGTGILDKILYIKAKLKLT